MTNRGLIHQRFMIFISIVSVTIPLFFFQNCTSESVGFEAKPQVESPNQPAQLSNDFVEQEEVVEPDEVVIENTDPDIDIMLDVFVDPDQGNTPPIKTITKTENFSVTSERDGSLDLIWVIDNSASMNQEAAHVRENLLSFVSHIEDEVDFKMSVISYKSTRGTGVVLPPNLDSSRFTQIDQRISSRNGVQKLADLLSLPKRESKSLSSFFRPNSSKGIIFVTDDNSNMKSYQFMDFFNANFSTDKLKVYGFVGLGRTESPCQAVTGRVYSELVQETNGKMYNICDADWRPHFETLATTFVNQAQTRFQLTSEVTKKDIKSITLNGRFLSNDDFEIEQSLLIVKPKLMTGEDVYNLSVKYEIIDNSL